MSDFVTTRWSVVLAAGRQGLDHDRAMAGLCQDYWQPLYAYARRRGNGPEEARDLTQEFFARLLEKGWLDGIEQEGGRFRSFLLCAFQRLMLDLAKQGRAAKRGGGLKPLSLDWETAEGRLQIEPEGNEESPERAFDRRWALEVMHRALERLRAESENSRHPGLFAALQPFLASEPAAGDYERIGSPFGLGPNAVAAAVRRLRLRYREVFRAEVADTLADPTRVDEELNHLLAALRPA